MRILNASKPAFPPNYQNLSYVEAKQEEPHAHKQIPNTPEAIGYEVRLLLTGLEALEPIAMELREEHNQREREAAHWHQQRHNCIICRLFRRAGFVTTTYVLKHCYLTNIFKSICGRMYKSTFNNF